MTDLGHGPATSVRRDIHDEIHPRIDLQFAKRQAGSRIPRHRQASPNLGVAQFSLQQRVRFLVLLQLAENGSVTRATTAVVCPGADRRDLEAALEHLIDEGSIQGPARHLSSLVALAEDGQMKLTWLGRRRLNENDV